MNRGKKYKVLVEMQGYTIAEISRNTGIPYTTINSMIDRNFKNASIDTVIKLAQAINVSIEDFILEDNSLSNKVLKIYSFKTLKKTFYHESLSQPVTVEIVEQIFTLIDTNIKIKYNEEFFVIAKENGIYLMPFGVNIFLSESQLNIYKNIIDEMELQNIQF